MGRLMLNVLLSFAQFEREIISERTRDSAGLTAPTVCRGPQRNEGSVAGATVRALVNPKRRADERVC
jgi:hypothetical protein